MTMLERREKCRQNRLAEQHFRPLGARQTRSRLLPAPLEARGPTPPKTLPINAVQSIGGVGIGESKRKSRLMPFGQILKSDDSCIANPKSEVAYWTGLKSHYQGS